MIYDIQILSVKLPKVTFRVSCSKGTYIRSLCQDIGNALGCGGAMGRLRRIKAAGFTIEDAYTLEAVEKARDENRLQELIHPVDEVYIEYPKAVAKLEADILLQNGNAIKSKFVVCEKQAPLVRMYRHQGDFVGIFSYNEGTKEYRPMKMFFSKNEE